jgi:pantothenate kinase-related protein Tda10
MVLVRAPDSLLYTSVATTCTCHLPLIVYLSGSQGEGSAVTSAVSLLKISQ